MNQSPRQTAAESRRLEEEAEKLSRLIVNDLMNILGGNHQPVVDRRYLIMNEQASHIVKVVCENHRALALALASSELIQYKPTLEYRSSTTFALSVRRYV